MTKPRVRKRRRPDKTNEESEVLKRVRKTDTYTKLTDSLLDPGESVAPIEMWQRRPSGIIDIGVTDVRGAVGFYINQDGGLACYTIMGTGPLPEGYKYLGRANNLSGAMSKINTPQGITRARSRAIARKKAGML